MAIADEFTKKEKRCFVQLRVPRRFSALAKECLPTMKQACAFEKIDVVDINNGAHYEEHDLETEHPTWQFLGCGVGRCAFKFKPKCVVKFARSAREHGTVIGGHPWDGVTGDQSNTYEVASYNLADEKVKNLLAPIIAHSPKADYKWIVVPMARTKKNDSLSYEQLESIESTIDSELSKMNAKCQDIHDENIGLLMDKYPVLIDYGFSVTCKRSAKKPSKARKVMKLGEFMPTHVSPKKPRKSPRSTIGKLGFFPDMPQHISPRSTGDFLEDLSKMAEGKLCAGNANCPTGQACVDNKCKKPTAGDVEAEVNNVMDKYWEIPRDARYELREQFQKNIEEARNLERQGFFLSAMDRIEIVKEMLKGT